MLAAGWLIAGVATPAAAQVSRVSTTSANGEANGASTGVDISADGRFVAFVSSATNLVANDTNASPDVFVKDLQTGVVTRVSVRTDGTEAVGTVGMPELSNDGRYVSFLTGKALVPEDTNPDCFNPSPCGDVYVHDRQTGITTRESVGSNGAQAEMWVDRARLSGNGRFVLFASPSSNLTPDPAVPGLLLFIRDRQLATTTRVPLPGMHLGSGVERFAISDDGQVIAFSLPSMGTDNAGDTLPCADRFKCSRVYVHTRQNGQTTRIEPVFQRRDSDPVSDVHLGDMSADGRHLLLLGRNPENSGTTRSTVYDRVTSSFTPTPFMWDDRSRLALSGDGRSLVRCDIDQFGYLTTFDLTWRAFELLSAPGGCASAIAVSANGNRLVWDSTQTDVVTGDTNGVADVFLHEADEDGDGLPSLWETRFGLDPTNPADALQDPDGDGVSSLAEYQAGSHPNGVFRRYFAEGAANPFFDYRLSLFANGENRAVRATYVGANGKTATQMFRGTSGMISAYSNGAGGFEIGYGEPAGVELPDSTFSVMLESSAPFTAERTMMWGGATQDERYGSTTLRAIEAPSTTWFFGEGATGPYSLYYLLQNPGDAPAKVTIHYLRPALQAPIVLEYTVAPHSRKTIDVNGEPGLSHTEVSARIVSDVPILAERAMYFSTPTQVFAGGHIGAGIAAPATEWFVAEGATGFFKTYLSIANPSEQAADLLVSYLLADGTRIDVPHIADGERRLSIDVADDDPRLAATTMSVIVTSRNNVPVVVERVSYWPSGAPIESSLTAGSTERGRRWAVAEAPASPTFGSETFLLVANPTDEAGDVRIKLRGWDDYSMSSCDKTYAVQPHSRLTVSVRDLCDLTYTKTTIFYSGTVESSGPAIVVERSTYVTRNGSFWGIGDSAALTRLPDVP